MFYKFRTFFLFSSVILSSIGMLYSRMPKVQKPKSPESNLNSKTKSDNNYYLQVHKQLNQELNKDISLKTSKQKESSLQDIKQVKETNNIKPIDLNKLKSKIKVYSQKQKIKPEIKSKINTKINQRLEIPIENSNLEIRSKIKPELRNIKPKIESAHNSKVTPKKELQTKSQVKPPRAKSSPKLSSLSNSNNTKNLSNSSNTKSFNLDLPNRYKMPVSYLERNSDILLILGPGYNATKEKMAIFSEIFNSYDVLVFDYRWAANIGYKLYPSTIFNPIKALLLDELEEVQAIINFVKNSKKRYKKIIGLAECYSTYLFLLAQINSQKQGNKDRFFDKLILDSTWHSFNAFADIISQDPILPFYSGLKSGPRWVSKFFNATGLDNLVCNISDKYWRDIQVKPLIEQVRETPILFIHGINDLFVPIDYFQDIFASSCKDNSLAILTPYNHSRNARDRDIYRYIGENFIEQDFKDFKGNLESLL